MTTALPPPLIADSEALAWAKIYASIGWDIFPTHGIRDGRCTCGSPGCGSPGKHPLVPGGVHAATSDRATIETWWTRHPWANIGLPAGANRLAVIDVDPRHGGDDSYARLATALARLGEPLAPTLTAITGSGGRHYVYAEPDGGVKSDSDVLARLGLDLPGIDTRGRGGYIVVAPSSHASGGAYQWEDWTVDPAPWPTVLTTLTTPPREIRPAATPPREIGNRYLASAVAREVDAVRSTREGGRNARLNQAAFALGTLCASSTLTPSDVGPLLLDAALAAGLPQREAETTIRSGLRAGMMHPRAVAA